MELPPFIEKLTEPTQNLWCLKHFGTTLEKYLAATELEEVEPEEEIEDENPFCSTARHRRFINECWNGGYN